MCTPPPPRPPPPAAPACLSRCPDHPMQWQDPRLPFQTRRLTVLSTFVRRCRGLVPAFAAATFASATPGLAQDIKIGSISDMSASGAAEFGLGALWGAQQAAQDINPAGGVLGPPLALVARDDMAQPPKAIQGVTELLDSEKVGALIGSANSGQAPAWRPPAPPK